MPVTYKPKSKFKALNLTASIPHYNFTDAFNKKEVRINDHEIKNIFSSKKLTYIQFRKDNFDSSLIIETENCQILLPTRIETITSAQFSKNILNIFALRFIKYIPTSMGIAIWAFIVVLLTLNSFIFTSPAAKIWQEKTFVNQGCDLVCANRIFSSFGALSSILCFTVFPLIFGVSFYFWRKPKIKEWTNLVAFKRESLVMLLIIATIVFELGAKFSENPGFQKLAMIYKKLNPSTYELSSKVKE